MIEPRKPDHDGPAQPADIGLADWSELLAVVAQRLAGAAATLAPEARHGVLDCVAVLGRLRQAAQREFEHCAQLALETEQVRQTLQQVQAELAGTRAGEARAMHVANHDGLTALANRQAFRARLDEALAQPALPGLAVMYLDLDGFKAVNDQHGHEVGDQLLRIVAERLRRAVRGGDLWGRLGGDEFACLFAHVVHRKQLGAMARKLVAAVSAPLTLGLLRLVIRPSIGIAMAPLAARSTTGLLACADAAMYRAKRTQSGHAFYEPLLDDPAAGASVRLPDAAPARPALRPSAEPR